MKINDDGQETGGEQDQSSWVPAQGQEEDGEEL